MSIYFSLSENIKNFFTNYFSNQLYPSIINIIFEITNFVNKTENPKIFGFISIDFLRESFYRNIIKFNMLIYVIGNLLILIAYFKNFKNDAYNLKYIFVINNSFSTLQNPSLYKHIKRWDFTFFVNIFSN